MGKIQIHFNESDYKFYFKYCLRYYQVHDAVRKQSIQAVLDLFEKGFIPVDEQDIRRTRQFIAVKCDELKKEYQGAWQAGGTIQPLRVRICSDLLIFIDDLEKMFRLLQKQGFVANYLMILGTFHKVIQESRLVPISGVYDISREAIEALARPLAGIITLRLGTDRQWPSVLRELTFIAARFNQKFPDPKFDIDILQLIAPAVVAYFNKDVELPGLQSVLISCFEESEVDEFESILNRTPEVLKIDQEADIDWDAIAGPLTVIAGAVAAQREQWSQSMSELSDQSLSFLPAGIPSLDTGDYPAEVTAPLPPNLPQVTGYQTFDIVVSPESPSLIEVQTVQVSSPVWNPLSGTGPVRTKLKPFMPAIIAVAAILFFIIGTSLVSGTWNFLGNTTNATATPLTTTTTAQPTATTAATATTAGPAATTAAPTATPVPAPAGTPAPAPQSYTSADIANHLGEIAFGPDNSGIVKPTQHLIEVAYTGDYEDEDIVLMNNFIAQFNNNSQTTKISTNIDLSGPADIWLYLLPETSLRNVRLDDATRIYKSPDLQTFYVVYRGNITFVNTDLRGNFRKRWILRGFLVNLGFYGETGVYNDSLFYKDTNLATSLSEFDLKALQLMYGKKITFGMSKSSVKSVS